ncbi:hypothetical protein [Streptomyces sp. NPDC021203]
MREPETPEEEEVRSDVLPWIATVAVFLMYLIIALAVFVAG